MPIKFKSKQVDNSAERLICTGIIVSDMVLAQLAPILSAKIMTARYTSYITQWCLDYYKQFEAAPHAHIQDIFEAHKREHLDDDVADLIAALLSSLNDEAAGSQINEEYLLDEAEKYIKARNAQIMCEDALALISKGQVTEAEGKIAAYSIPKRASADGVDVFSKNFWIEQEEQSEVLFRLPGALDDLVGPIERDSFISFLAAEKVGKTWHLLNMALTAYRQRNNVVFFSCGDMTLPQMRKRIGHMLTGRDPKRRREQILIPVLDCRHNQRGECPLDEDTDPVLIGPKTKQTIGTYQDFPDHIPCARCYKAKDGNKTDFVGAVWHKMISPEEYEKPLDATIKAITQRAANRQFKLFCYPPAELTVARINAELDILQAQEGFFPDVVLIDYADLLAPEPSASRLEYRHQINASWMALRALSQVRKCAVITATQAKIEARRKMQVDQWDTSEDKRKLAHVTAMLALNQTPAEKRQGVMRISNIAMRDQDFDVERNVAVLQCLAIGKPYLSSFPCRGRVIENAKDGLR